MWRETVVVILIAQSARGSDGHAGHDHSAQVPSTLQPRSDFVEVAKAAGKVQVIGVSPEFWSAMPSSPTSYTVPTGTALTFRFSMEHNLYLMGSKAAYDSCDLSDSIELAGMHIHGGEAGQPPNLYEVVMTTAGTYYMTCHVAGHCGSGQKITVNVVDSGNPPPSPPPGTASSGGSGCGGGCIGGIVGGSFVPLLVLVLWLGGAFGAKCPSPLRPPAKAAEPSKAVVTAASAA